MHWQGPWSSELTTSPGPTKARESSGVTCRQENELGPPRRTGRIQRSRVTYDLRGWEPTLTVGIVPPTVVPRPGADQSRS